MGGVFTPAFPGVGVKSAFVLAQSLVQGVATHPQLPRQVGDIPAHGFQALAQVEAFIQVLRFGLRHRRLQIQ